MSVKSTTPQLPIEYIDRNDALLSKTYANLSPRSQDQYFSTICALIREGRWQTVASLSDLDKIVNSAGLTILIYFIIADDPSICRELINRKITLHTPARSGNFPIHYAARSRNKEFYEMLMIESALDERNTFTGSTPMHEAASQGNEATLQALLKSCKQNATAVAECNYGETKIKVIPAALSIMNGHSRCVDLFVEHFAQLTKAELLDAKCPGIGNLLHIAVFFQQNDILGRLLGLHIEIFKDLINAKNDRGQTPAMLAASIGNVRALELLVEKRASLSIVDLEENTALHLAVLGGHIPAVLFLLKAHYPLLSQLNNRHITPQTLAKECGNQSLFNLFNNVLRGGSIPLAPGESEGNNYTIFVLQGGAIKGLGLGGFAQAADAYGLLNRVKILGSTSAGALTASLLAVGYNSRRIIKICREEMKFMELFDHGFPGKLLPDIIKDPSLGNTFKLLMQVKKWILHPAGAALDLLKSTMQSLWKAKGICSGNKLREVMENYFFEATNIKYYTLGDHRKAIEQGKPLKHIHMFTTKIGPNAEILDINSEDPQWDDFILSSAVRASAAFPGVWNPEILQKRVFVQGVAHSVKAVEYECVDGGMLCNLGLERFDQKRYVTTQYTEADKNYPTFNPNVLGVSFYDPTDKVQLDKPTDNIFDFLYNLASIYFGAEKFFHDANPYNATRTVFVSTNGVHTLKFNLSDAEKDGLIQSGVDALTEFLKKRRGISNQRLEDIAKKKQTTESPFQVVPQVEIKSDQNLSYPGEGPGIYVTSQCDNMRSCKVYDQIQWKKLTPENNRVDIGEVQNKLKCVSCNTKLNPEKIKVVLYKSSATLIYNDDSGTHQQMMDATHQILTMDWAGNLYSLAFNNIKP